MVKGNEIEMTHSRPSPNWLSFLPASSDHLHPQRRRWHRIKSKRTKSSSIVLAEALWLVVSREVDVIAHQMNRTGQSRVQVCTITWCLCGWRCQTKCISEWQGSDTWEGCKIALILMCSDIYGLD